jgi:molybdopterin-guanine dinucleotide biosynthesis protein A
MSRGFSRHGNRSFDDVTAVILAGGQSSRMASFRAAPKAFLRVGGETVIEREVRALGAVFKDIVVISNEPEPYLDLGLQVIPDSDRFPDIKGPIKGIFTGLNYIAGGFGFFVACYMPFINPALVEWMGRGRAGHDVVIPKIGGFFEPLFGYYAKSALPVIEQAMNTGIRRIQDVFFRMDIEVIGDMDVRLFDPEFESFINLNTPEDLTRAESIIGRPFKTAIKG